MRTTVNTSLLHCVSWGRIILDEAHKIKGRTNSTAKACYALRAVRRWCLTGTPLQNRVSELYALIRFLRVDPFAFYFCRTHPECRSLHWGFGTYNRHCTQCGCAPMRHFSYFNKTVTNPITRYGYVGEGKRALLTLHTEILGRIMLRRTKVERAGDMKLPPLTKIIPTKKQQP